MSLTTIYRYSVEILASGQPRAYADHFGHVRLTIEIKLRTHTGEGERWEPSKYWEEKDVRELLKHLKCGFPNKEPESWVDTKLTSIKQTSPGVWEFTTSTAYTG